MKVKFALQINVVPFKIFQQKCTVLYIPQAPVGGGGGWPIMAIFVYIFVIYFYETVKAIKMRLPNFSYNLSVNFLVKKN